MEIAVAAAAIAAAAYGAYATKRNSHIARQRPGAPRTQPHLRARLAAINNAPRPAQQPQDNTQLIVLGAAAVALYAVIK